MLAVKIDQLFLSNMGFVVLLKEEDGNRSLPIFIGAAEAQSIAIIMNEIQVPRPLTHDLLKNTLGMLECRLKKVEVCDIKEGTFYARLVLDRGAGEITMDSRPSDGIALALRCSAPIYVAESVMSEAGRVFDESEVSGSGRRGDKDGGSKKLSPLETLKKELGVAVEEERYEDAAKLRDEIKRVEKNTHN